MQIQGAGKFIKYNGSGATRRIDQSVADRLYLVDCH
jgi:hypothetical protein